MGNEVQVAEEKLETEFRTSLETGSHAHSGFTLAPDKSVVSYDVIEMRDSIYARIPELEDSVKQKWRLLVEWRQDRPQSVRET